MMGGCTLCPRGCNVDRKVSVGYCGAGSVVKIARCALHMWEEDCISGKEGSGAVFFSGCNLRCVYCQNYNLSHESFGSDISVDELADRFICLQGMGANNINLVTPTHYIPQIMEALSIAKNRGMNLPVVYNSSGYESVTSLRMLRGYVDVFLPDFKYFDNDRAYRYSGVCDYREVVQQALDAMYEIVGEPEFDERGIIQKGMIVRHLMLPGGIKDSKKILEYLHGRFKDNIYISIMSQYTPLPHVSGYSEINRKLYPAEYRRLVEYAMDIGIVNGYIQDMDTADESFIPEFYGDRFEHGEH